MKHSDLSVSSHPSPWDLFRSQLDFATVTNLRIAFSFLLVQNTLQNFRSFYYPLGTFASLVCVAQTLLLKRASLLIKRKDQNVRASEQHVSVRNG